MMDKIVQNLLLVIAFGIVALAIIIWQIHQLFTRPPKMTPVDNANYGRDCKFTFTPSNLGWEKRAPKCQNPKCKTSLTYGFFFCPAAANQDKEGGHCYACGANYFLRI